MSSDSGPSSNTRTLVRVAAVAASAVVAGAALYHFSRRSRPSPLNFDEVKKRKEEGNVHFVQKRYKEAIDAFTQAIDGSVKLEKTKELDDLIAICFQNRAASKQQLGVDVVDCVTDVASAIRLKPDYGRAYSRRAQLLKKEQPKQALADTLAAMHIDEKFSEQLVPIMTELMESLEKLNIEDLNAQKQLNPATRPVPITHEQVYLWLCKTTDSDFLRKRYFVSIGSVPTKNSEHVYEAIAKRDFEEAVKWADMEDGDAETTLLAARLAYFQGNLTKYAGLMDRFEKEVGQSENKQGLRLSAALLKLQMSKTVPELLELFEKTLSEFGPDPDIFSVAGFRATFLDDWPTAHTILTDKRIEKHSTVSQVIAYFVEINTIILKNENPMEAFKVIAKMEEYVDSLEDKDEHKNWAALALAKIYITFNNTNNAEVLLKELRRRDSTWTIYPIALAHVYTQMTEYKKAIEACDDALKQEPLNPEAHLLKGSLTLHAQGNRLSKSSLYEKIMKEAEPLVERCLSNCDFPFVSEVLRHVSFTQAKISASKSLGIDE